MLRPSDQFGVDLRQGSGAFGFGQSYARIDSGTLATGTKPYVSYSCTTADKWRGVGAPRRIDIMSLLVRGRNFHAISKRVGFF